VKALNLLNFIVNHTFALVATVTKPIAIWDTPVHQPMVVLAFGKAGNCRAHAWLTQVIIAWPTMPPPLILHFILAHAAGILPGIASPTITRNAYRVQRMAILASL